MRHEQRLQLRRRRHRGAAPRIDADVRIRPMRQQQLDERAVAVAVHGHAERRAAFCAGLRPPRIGTTLEQQLRDRAVAELDRSGQRTPACTSTVPIPPAAAAGAVHRVDVCAAIEQEVHSFERAPNHRAMQRRASAAVAALEEGRVGVEHLAHARNVIRFRGSMDGMILARRHPSHALARILEQSRDALVPTLARHLDQAAIVVGVVLRVGAGIEQHLHGFQMSRPHDEMDRLRVPVLRSSELRSALKQPPQRSSVATRRGGDGGPGRAAFLRLQLVRLDRSAGGAAGRRDVRAQRIPRVESVLLRDDALGITQPAEQGLASEQFLGLALELIEIGRRGQRASSHDGPPSESRLKSANRPKEGRAIGSPKTGGLSPWPTGAPCCAETG
jgi:hypothetical protein